jgi:RNA polymerase sigma-70 factor, ECF subfamily
MLAQAEAGLQTMPWPAGMSAGPVPPSWQPTWRLLRWDATLAERRAVTADAAPSMRTQRTQEAERELPEAAPAQREPEAEGLQQLIGGCLRGESRAQTELYRLFRAKIAGHLCRLLGGTADVEDALQDTFVEAFRSISRFRGEAKFSTWLHGIAVHVALRRLRSRGRQLPRGEADPEAFAREATQQRTLEAKRQLQRVFAILEHLPPKKRVVFVLHEIEGLELTEIAALVRAPQITVRTRLHYARKAFYARVALDPAFEGLGAMLERGARDPDPEGGVA